MADELVRRTGGTDWVPYWAAACARELRFQRCTGCRRWRHPPGPMCPHCLSMESEWARASGRARLVSWVVVHPPVLPAWKDRVPYPVLLVECEEGVGRSAASSARRPISSAWTCRWWSTSRPRRTGTSCRSGGRRDARSSMPRNIEIKARIASIEALAAKAAAIADQGPIEIIQDDTFFVCEGGRLKLRAFSKEQGELIFYRRANQHG